jgi:hypothetical protein
MTDPPSSHRHKSESQRIFKFVTGLMLVLGPAVVALLGVVFTAAMQRRLESMQMASTMSTMMSERESAEMTFRSTIFDKLVDRMLGKTNNLETRLAAFEIFEENFHDIFNGRSLFKMFDSELRKAGGRDTVLLERLWNLAAEVKDKELDIAVANPLAGRQDSSVDTMPITWSQVARIGDGDTAAYKVQLPQDDIHYVRLKVLAHTPTGPRVEFKFWPFVKDRGDSARVTNTFTVEYFDTPFADNTMLPDGHRLAVVMENRFHERNQFRSTLRVVEFPADVVVGGYRPSLGYVHKVLDEVRERRKPTLGDRMMGWMKF